MSDAPVPGWYADPVTPGQNRYWDGTAWTEHVAPVAPAAVPGSGSGVVAGDGGSVPRKSRRWLWILLAILGAVLLLFGGCTAIAVFSVKGAVEQAGSSIQNSLAGQDAATLPDGDYWMTSITSYFGFNDQCTWTGPVTDMAGDPVGVFSVTSTVAGDCEDGMDAESVAFTVEGSTVTVTDRVLGVARY